MSRGDVTASSSARRTRILFIDDKREVAKTLSGLLPGANVICSFAENGEAGLATLLSEVSDLAVVDLRMPPGQWGGLWLLRELSDRGLLVDTLVLSGEAGQAETIEAMRLGALDFVVKSNASDELAKRVDKALARGAQARSEYAVTDLPTPLALPYRRINVPRDDEGRLRASLTAAEAVVRFCALTAIAIARAEGTLDQSLLIQLARPSLGTWLDICRRLQPQVSGHAIDRWIRAVSGRDADLVVRHRNDTVHGGGFPAVGIARALADVLSWLDYFILAARSGSRLKLVVAGSMTTTQTSNSVDLAKLEGATSSVAWSTAETAHRLLTGRVYVRSFSDQFLDMWPLVVADRHGSTSGWDVAIVDGYRESHRGKITTDDRLRYIDPATGGRSLSPNRIVGELG